jgi:hypothetical protein
VTFLIPDDLTIPEFLKRELPASSPSPVHRRRAGKIAYPRDGYACVGMREAAREKHRARLRRRAERMRQPRRK